MNINKTSRQVQLQAVSDGIGKHFQGVSTLTLGGKAYLLADITQEIKSMLDDMAAVAKAKAAYVAQLGDERQALAKLLPTLALFKRYVVALYGDTEQASNTLADFGYTPRKTPKKSAATVAGAVEKNKATREARHTTGKRQKAKIKGTVPAIEPAPGAPPAAHS